MAKIFYVTENTPDYAQCHFFKTEKEALEYGISQLPQFDMFDEPMNDEEADGEEWYQGDSLDFKKGILFSQEEGDVYVQAMEDAEAREYVEEEGEYSAAIFFDGFSRGMYGYLGRGTTGKGIKWDWDGEDINENITPAVIGGMGPVVLPMDGGVGSGDVPAGRGDAEEEYKKKKRMKHLKSFEAFNFDYDGIDIKNPFTDETARQDVDPNSYYGKDYAKSDIKKIVDASELFVSKYTEWRDMQPLDADEDLHADFGEHVGKSLDELIKTIKKFG
jgi:hypothetical protein